MQLHINNTNVMNNDGTIGYGQLVNKPAGLVESVVITGSSNYFTVSYDSIGKVLTFNKSGAS